MSSPIRVSLLLFASVASAAAGFAGQGRGQRGAPDQGPRTGDRDDATVEIAGQQVHIDPATGRLRQPTPEEAAALSEALERQFGKRAEAVAITTMPNGAVRATLDESFMEALTVTRRPDGSLVYAHAPRRVAATPTAGASVAPRATAAPRAPRASTARSARKVLSGAPAQPATPAPSAPVSSMLEEK